MVDLSNKYFQTRNDLESEKLLRVAVAQGYKLPAGQVSSTFAIVEFEDGTVHEVELWNIRFIDNLTAEYLFEERNYEPR